jgi:hypothetical protein
MPHGAWRASRLPQSPSPRNSSAAKPRRRLSPTAAASSAETIFEVLTAALRPRGGQVLKFLEPLGCHALRGVREPRAIYGLDV